MKKIEAIIYLCENIVSDVYLPIREFIKTINKEGKTYDFGYRIELFKGKIEDTIMKIGVDKK